MSAKFREILKVKKKSKSERGFSGKFRNIMKLMKVVKESAKVSKFSKSKVWMLSS